jgi:predicted RND superfamily exporter protein
MSNNYVRGNMLNGIGLEFLVVSLAMGLLFRNLRMVLISLIPNILPIMVCGALLGFLGIELSASTAIIFGMTFGIVTDDTIHFLAGYRIERAKGLSTNEAVKETMLETGKAICMTTLILFFGFIILLTSSYPNTATIGLLVSITFLFALITDLFLTPVLVSRFMRGKRHKTA